MTSLLYPVPNLVKDVTLYGPDTRYSGLTTTNIFSPAGMEISNLALRDLSQVYRVVSSFRGKTFLEVDFGSAKTLDAMAILIASWSENATARVLVSNTGGTGNAYPFVQLLVPTDTVTASNLNGTGAQQKDAVNEDPDNHTTGDSQTATSASVDTEWIGSFATPDRSLLSSTDRQTFRVLAFLQGGAGSCSMRVDLFEGGVQVRQLGTFTVDKSLAEGGNLGTFTWSGSELSAISGVNAEVRCVGLTAGGRVPVLGAFAWYAALDTLVHDSGDLDVLPTLVDGTNFGLRKNLFYVFSTAATGRFLRIEVDDATSTYLDFSRLIAGREVMQGVGLSRDVAERDYGSEPDYSMTTMDVLQSGQAIFDVRPAPMVRSIAFELLSEAEANILLDQVAQRIGTGGEIVFLPDTDIILKERVYRGMYATLESFSKSARRTSTGRCYDIRMRLRELLSV